MLNSPVGALQLISDRRRSPSVAATDLLRVLPTDERDVISLVRSHRLTYREVATVLGISEDTVKRRLRSGLVRLRTEMLRTAAATA